MRNCLSKIRSGKGCPRDWHLLEAKLTSPFEYHSNIDNGTERFKGGVLNLALIYVNFSIYGESKCKFLHSDGEANANCTIFLPKQNSCSTNWKSTEKLTDLFVN